MAAVSCDDNDPKKPVPPLFDGKYFSIVSINNDKVEAKCVHCVNKTISGGLVFTSNFKVHMKVCNMLVLLVIISLRTLFLLAI